MSLLLLPAAATPAPPGPPALQLPLAAVRQLPGRRQLPAVPCAGVAASQAARLVVGIRLLLLPGNPLPKNNNNNKNKIRRSVTDPDFHLYTEQEPDSETEKVSEGVPNVGINIGVAGN
jgi:hypothetical protein